MNNQRKSRKAERGSAGVKMIAVLVALFLVGHAAYQYVPVAYEGQSFKQDMQTAVVQGMAVPVGITPVEMVRGKIQKAIVSDGIPSNALVEVKPSKETVSARVAYSKLVPILPFGLWTYNYQFDHTATPTGFLLKTKLRLPNCAAFLKIATALNHSAHWPARLSDKRRKSCIFQPPDTVLKTARLAIFRVRFSKIERQT